MVISFFIDIYYTEFRDEICTYLEPSCLSTFLFYCQRINSLKWKINIASARISHLHTNKRRNEKKNVTINIRIRYLIVNCYGYFVCASTIMTELVFHFVESKGSWCLFGRHSPLYFISFNLFPLLPSRIIYYFIFFFYSFQSQNLKCLM